jgi:hypothetical protein
VRKLLLVAALAAVSGSALAGGYAGNVGVGLGYDVLSGPMVKAHYDVNDWVSLHASMSTGRTLTGSGDSSGDHYDYDMQIKQNTLGVAVHPFAGRFFLKAGYAMQDSYLQGTATTNQYSVPATADTKIKFDNGAMLTFGWEGRSKGFSFGSEFGVMKTTASVDRFDVTGAAPGDQALIDANKAKLAKDLANIDMIPVVNLSVGYNF